MCDGVQLRDYCVQRTFATSYPGAYAAIAETRRGNVTPAALRVAAGNLWTGAESITSCNDCPDYVPPEETEC